MALATPEPEDPDLSGLVGARGVILKGNDDDDAAMAPAGKTIVEAGGCCRLFPDTRT